ncbi:MAG TPA: hypothetical protein PKE49_03665 [Leptospiraceae bacterium]|jgi:hypothetical protein|nr:hypothetical protein [Leptospirales bacterium]HMU82590.1 hypothetical protein [Leptospiraceae bacterium]HMW58012.1 hypothetical protein [Leptospiraceae bacterium]HMX55592.1 hypothetical protein [Leptospiraceae bacterium]HMY45301.1 hypothetical protein [Leptospiraceae bacterium]
MQIESGSPGFEAISRSTRMLNELNQTIVDKTQEFQSKAVKMNVAEQVTSSAENQIDLQA